MRLAAPFERLRDRGDRALDRNGVRPRIYSLNLGPLAMHQARAEFAANLFGAAGLEMVGAKPPEEGFDAVAPAIAAYRASGCRLVVVCGRDPDYASFAGSLLVELRAAGAACVWIAGRPSNDVRWEHPPEPPPEFIHLGCDALAACELALATLGLTDDDDHADGEEG